MLFRRFLATKVADRVSDILIVGGGPAGLTVGAAIKNSPILKNLKCTLVEGANIVEDLTKYTAAPPPHILNRCVSIIPATIDFQRRIGAWKYVNQERIQDYGQIRTYDGLTNSAMEFEADSIGTLIENYNMQAALLQRIRELKATGSPLEILDNAKVTRIDRDPMGNEWPTVHLSTGETIKTRLLIGCDGGRSPVRKSARIESRGWAYNQWGLVATLRYKDSGFRAPTGWQRFLPTGPLAQLPLPNNWVSLVWSVPPELAMVLMSLSDELFVSVLNAASKLSVDELSYLYKIARDAPAELQAEIDWRMGLFNAKLSLQQQQDYPLEVDFVVPKSRGRFPLKLSHADDYVDERLALVGDAAHTTHPLAGQGLNMGQADAECLVATLETAMERGLDIGTRFALEPYFSERYPANHALLGVMDKIHKVYSSQFGPLVWARSLGVDVLNNLPFVKDLMVGQISHRKL